jgi:TetR/AcrR family transcriptional regulator, mexJK operon transcriptional repressor
MQNVHARTGRPPDPAKRAAAMAAAQRLFLDQGFERTSMAAIARAAGVAKPTLYALFGDKSGLFAAAVADKCARVLGDLGALPDAHDARAALVEAGRRFLTLILDPEALHTHRLVAAERERHPELGALFFRNAILFTRARFAALFAELRTRGLAIEDGELAATELLALLRGWPVLLWELGAPPLDPPALDAHVRRAVEVVLRAHLAPGVEAR